MGRGGVSRSVASLIGLTAIGAGAAASQIEIEAEIYNPEGGLIPLFLEVFVNGSSTELVAEFSYDIENESITSQRTELLEVGINPGGKRGDIALNELEGVIYEYDETSQSIHFIAEESARHPEIISAARAGSHTAADPSLGGVLNYSTYVELDSIESASLEYNQFSLALDGWLFSPYGRLSNSGAFRVDARGDTQALRFNTYYERSFSEPALTIRIGDTISSSMDWGRSVRMAGLQIRRDFELRRDLVTEPLLSFEGSAAVPSSVDVFIDNARVFSGGIDEGPFRLEDIPLYSGAGEALIVIRDETGEVITRKVPFFASRNLLKKGTADFSVEAGFARRDYATIDSTYDDDLLYSGSVRYGVSDRLTLSAHLEGGPDLSLLSMGFAAVAANRAELGFSIGQSDYGGERAKFAYGTVRTNFRQLELQGSFLRADEGFSDLAFATATNFAVPNLGETENSLIRFPVAQDILSLSLPLDRKNSFAVSYVRSERTVSSDEIVTMNYSRAVAGGTALLNVTGAYDVGASETRVGALFSIQLGKGHTQTKTSWSDREKASGSLAYFQPIGEEVGSRGYSAAIEGSSGRQFVAGELSQRTRFGIANLSARRYDDDWRLRGRFDGSIVSADGLFAAGNTVRDSFAIVDVGVPDVTVSLQNRNVAKTGSRGRALVAGLTSHSPNRISVSSETVPDDVIFRATAMDVVPARQAGVSVEFGAVVSDASATATLVDSTGALLPAGSTGFLNGRSQEIFVGFDGIVFLTNLRAANTIVVDTHEGSCTVAFATESAPAQQDLGTLVCH